jgi:hypothetical protein
MQVPSLFHAEDLQIHVSIGSRYSESEPVHPVHRVSFLHPVQLLLQAK